MKNVKRYSVKVVSEVGYNHYESVVIYNTDCRITADAMAFEQGGTVVDNHYGACLVKLNGAIVGFLNNEDIENGLDIKLSHQGFEIEVF